MHMHSFGLTNYLMDVPFEYSSIAAMSLFSVEGGGGINTERRRSLIHFISFFMLGNCR